MMVAKENRYDNICKCHFKGRHLTDHETLVKGNKEVKTNSQQIICKEKWFIALGN